MMELDISGRRMLGETKIRMALFLLSAVFLLSHPSHADLWRAIELYIARSHADAVGDIGFLRFSAAAFCVLFYSYLYGFPKNPACT